MAELTEDDIRADIEALATKYGEKHSQKRSNQKVTVEQIREGMATIAQIIDEEPSGEKLWPIFERLERELAARTDRKERLAAARATVASDR
jgi:hypothetical protein